MKKEDWTSELRNRLADFEEPAPEGLWEGIESKLPTTGSTQRKLVTLWRYAAAAAAILLLVVVGTELLWHGEENPVTTVKYIAKETHDAIVQQSENVDMITKNDIRNFKTTSPTNENPAIEILPTENQITESPTTENPTKENTAIENQKTENQSPKANNQKPKTKNSKPGTKNQKPKISTGLYAYNPIGSSQMSSSGVVASHNITNLYSASMAKRAPLYLDDYKEEAEHNQPTSFGLSLSYNLNDRLWLESGVVYTRVSSTFTHKAASRSLTDEQTLQYVGIPLRLGYTIWKHKRLNVYAIAGGEADFNTKAEIETEGITREIGKDRIQWSANASAGVQYNFLPQFGVYVEPGMKYYIDNGSNIDNIFKDKKLDFSIQIGLRCLLNK